MSPDHGTDILWVIRQDIPECHTPEPGVKLRTACERNKDDPSVRAINVKVVPRDESQDVWIDVNTEREIKSYWLVVDCFLFLRSEGAKTCKEKTRYR